jgi:regulator of cell morphogenesis and NO signaling
MTDPSIDPTDTLAELVEQNPGRARVFESLGLDFCCGGKRPLEEAVEATDLAVDEIVDRLREADERQEETDAPASDASMTEWVDHIVETHHAYLKEELDPLAKLVDKVVGVHGENHPELEQVQEAYQTLAREMPVHLSEEEQILFPAIRHLEGHGTSSNERETARQLVQGLEQDHDNTAECLEVIREATDDFEVPDDACPSYRNMLERLERLERDIHMHVHRENNVLFPRVVKRMKS